MKYGPWIVFLIVMGLTMVNNPQSTQARLSRLDSLWIQAEKAEKEGLPATAETRYQQIYPIELSNRKWPEATGIDPNDHQSIRNRRKSE